MRYIWNLLSTLQIITHFTLIGIKFPEIFIQVNKSIVEIANGNLIPKEYIQSLKSYLSSLLGSATSEVAEATGFD